MDLARGYELRLWCAALVGWWVLLAAGGEAAEGKPVTVRFLAERRPAELGQAVVVAGEARSEPFDLPHNHLSEPVAVAARVFELRTLTPERKLAVIRLPEEGRGFIVLLIPVPEGGYRSLVIRSDDPAFRPGDVYFYNHSRLPVIGYVGATRFAVGPAEGVAVRPRSATGERFYEVGFGVREPGGDRVLSTTRWPVDNQLRSYVFFYQDPRTGRLDYRAVDEFVPPPPRPAGGG